MQNLIIGIMAGIFGTLICLLLKRIFLYFRNYKNSEYSGKWEDIIPSKPDGSPEKHDEYEIKHNKRNNCISGKVKRLTPPEQNTRTWDLSGIIDGEYFIASFWHRGPQKSNGCIYAKLTADNTYNGFYLEEHNNIIDQTPITLKKK